MTEKVYKVNTPLQHNGKKIAAGALVELKGEHAEQLLAAGAISEASASEADSAEVEATKGKGKK